MTLDNMTGITKGSYTGFCKRQLITCNFAKACNGVCPFEDALKHADKTQTMNEQHTVDHDRDWIIGCIEHDGFIHTHRFDKANQIIHDALSAEAVSEEEHVKALNDLAVAWKNKLDEESYEKGYTAGQFADRPHGEWTYLSGSKGSYMTISCPICGSTFDNVAEWKYHFCPNCGARMKGGDTK